MKVIGFESMRREDGQSQNTCLTTSMTIIRSPQIDYLESLQSGHFGTINMWFVISGIGFGPPVTILCCAIVSITCMSPRPQLGVEGGYTKQEGFVRTPIFSERALRIGRTPFAHI